MSRSVFPYAGGKGRYADWIIEHLPDHECYVEPFGGSGSVLANKPKSHIEVYNDLNGELVHFFETLRDHPDNLREWLEATPYSRELHERWTTSQPPDDDIERAGRFFYLRCTQFGGRIDLDDAGFKTRNNSSSVAQGYRNRTERLEQVADRFHDVIIEALDWTDCVEKYDGVDVCFYFDPPYYDCHHYYHGNEFDHTTFISVLEELQASWVCSYSDLPDSLPESWTVKTRETWYQMNQGQNGGRNETERLVMNFEPTETRMFGRNQALDDFA